jgi:hypothetical protein
MPTTNGPCRFGEYSRLQEMILEENGIRGISIFSPSSGDGYDALRELSNRFYYTIWKGMACIDILFKTRLLLRPLEATPGETDRVYRGCLDRIETNLEQGGRRLLGTMRECAERFAAIPVVARELVRIGLVGEIYVRSNRFANSDIIRTAESLGVAVMPAPFGEWSFYANHLSRKNNLDQGRFIAALADTSKTGCNVPSSTAFRPFPQGCGFPGAFHRHRGGKRPLLAGPGRPRGGYPLARQSDRFHPAGVFRRDQRDAFFLHARIDRQFAFTCGAGGPRRDSLARHLLRGQRTED